MANKSVIRTPVSVEPIADRSGVCWIFSPCTDEDCDHLCCQQYREEAAMVCPVCGEAIGYDSAHIFCDGYYVHAGCTVDLLLAAREVPENTEMYETYGQAPWNHEAELPYVPEMSDSEIRHLQYLAESAAEEKATTGQGTCSICHKPIDTLSPGGYYTWTGYAHTLCAYR